MKLRSLMMIGAVSALAAAGGVTAQTRSTSSPPATRTWSIT